MRTFRHGIHPPSNKHTKNTALADFSVPASLFFSVAQHIGAPAKPVVAVGDHVKEGQLIAEAGGFVSAPVFSSVSGTVKGIVKRPTVTGGECDHIEVENDFLYEKTSFEPLVDPDAKQILARIKDAGIVGMGGATFPTHVKLSPSKPVDVLIINGAECEPYITCDHRMMVERTEAIVKGIGYLMKVLGVEKAYIGIENNKKDALERFCEECPPEIIPVQLLTKYPQGAEKQLIYSIVRRIVPKGGLPMDVGCVVNNIHTAYAVQRAVDEGEPLYRRAMTVSGDGVEKKGNYFVRTGIPFSFIYDETRGAVPTEDTRKVISGGPMMGFALANLNPCTTKGSSSLLFLNKKEFNQIESTQCINCGRCINACPANLMPRDIERAVVRGNYQEAAKLEVSSCLECGVCSYACPAKRPLVQAFRLAKKIIRERGIK